MNVQKYYEPLTEDRLEEIKKLQKTDVIYGMVEGQTHKREGYPTTETELKKMPELNHSVEGFYIIKNLGDNIIPSIMTKEKYDMYLNDEVLLPKFNSEQDD